jgi:hypothetical protein
LKTAKLIRKYSPKQTDGFLLFDSFKIKTIERPDLNNRKMVSCIPEGEYLVKWGHMNTHNVDHYLLQNVKDRTAIFIHIASNVDQIHGCIGASRLSIELLEKWGAKEDFKLTISS